MARGTRNRNNRRSGRTMDQRDFHKIATLEKFSSPVLNPVLPPSTSLTQISDRRRFNPSPSPPRTTRGKTAKIKAVPRFKASLPSVQFLAPPEAIICVRRKRRRQVLFAKAGAGRRKFRSRKRYNETSKYSC